MACNGNVQGYSPPPEGLMNVSSVCVGYQHACAVSGGRVTCWGDNSFGQGNVPMGLADAVLVKCSTYFTCALTAARTVSCWGQHFRSGWVNVTVPASMTTNVGQLSVGGGQMCVTVPQEEYGSSGTLSCLQSDYATPGLELGVLVDHVGAGIEGICTIRQGTVACFSNDNTMNVIPA